MKKTKLLILTVLPFLVGGCSSTESSSPETSSEPSSSSSKKEPADLVRKEIEVTMVSHFKGDLGSDEFTDTVLYDDHYFLEDPKTVNYGLALMSTFADGASYSNDLDNNGYKIAAYLSAAGYTKIQKNEYYRRGVKLDDSLGVIIGQKTIHDYDDKAYTLLAIFPRNAGYGAEWAGNFNIGENGIHEGFLEARDEMLRFTKNYITTNKVEGALKVWTAGYSRGAAATNLFAGYLAEDTTYFGDKVTLSNNDLFAYTIGTPRSIASDVTKAQALSVSGPRSGEYTLDTNVAAYEYKGEGNINPSADNYKGIHNFTAIGDYITKLPPKDWSFTRYGVTEDVLYGGDKFVEYLAEYSQETADSFHDKDYSTKIATHTIDFANFDIKDTTTKVSADETIEARITELMSLAGNRKDFIDAGYADLLAAATSIFGLDYKGFYDKAMKGGVGGLAKVGVLAYLAYAGELMDKTDKEALASIAMDLVELLGINIEDRENYTDQQFLADLLDFLFNDPKASARAEKVSKLIPEPYKALYPNLLKFAKDNSLTPRTFDGLVDLLAKYIHANKTDKVIDTIVSLLGGLIPDEYMPYLGMLTGKTYDIDDYGGDEKAMQKAEVLDVLDLFAIGKYDGDELVASAQQIRGAVFTIVTAVALGPYQSICNLILNGSSYGETDPAKLSDFIAEILTLAMPKDDHDESLTLKEAANKLLSELLDSCKTDAIAKYIDALAAKPDEVRDILVTVLFNPGTTYNLKSDIDNALNFIETIQFLFPAHNHEMYTCYFKSKLSA